MLVEPSTLLNLPNSAASAGSGGCASNGHQEEKLTERRDAPVFKLASEAFMKAKRNLNNHICLYFQTGARFKAVRG